MDTSLIDSNEMFMWIVTALLKSDTCTSGIQPSEFGGTEANRIANFFWEVRLQAQLD